MICSDVIFPITLIGTASARTVTLLFTTFLTLYATQEYPNDKQKVESLIAKMNTISTVCAFIVVIPAGQAIDKVPARITIPVIFVCVSTVLIVFQFIPSPVETEWPLIICVTLIMIF